jgi:hypothetical protein
VTGHKPANYVGGRAKDETRLSTDPAQIRRRLRRSIGKPHHKQDLQLLVQAGGMKPIEEWDLEELARGMPKNKRGKFSGKPPTWITPDIMREAKKRLLAHTNALIGEQVDQAMAVIVDLMTDDSVDDKGRPCVDARTKLDAAKFIIEHVKGKATAVLELEASDHTRKMIAAAIVLDDGLPQDEPVILEGEFEEVEDDDDDSE